MNRIVGVCNITRAYPIHQRWTYRAGQDGKERSQNVGFVVSQDKNERPRQERKKERSDKGKSRGSARQLKTKASDKNEKRNDSIPSGYLEVYICARVRRETEAWPVDNSFSRMTVEKRNEGRKH